MKNLTCIVCPRGCELTIDDENIVSGFTCPRGKQYALSEITNPTRIVTASVKIANRKNTWVSVKTDKPIPKDRIIEALKIIYSLSVNAPCKIGQIVYKNLFNLDINIIITKNID